MDDLAEENANNQNWIGKEKDNENGLGDHGVRKYEYETGRFTSTDPLLNKYFGWTPYHYSDNNPISYADGNGLLKLAKKGTKAYADSKVQEDNHNIYKNYIYDLKNVIIPYIKASGILERLLEMPGVTEEEVLKDLEFGKGPEIYVTNYGSYYDELDLIQRDGKFEMALGIMQIAEDPKNWYGNGTDYTRAWRMVITIHGYLHDKFDLTHPQIFYVLGGDKKNHPTSNEVSTQLEEDLDADKLFRSEQTPDASTVNGSDIN